MQEKTDKEKAGKTKTKGRCGRRPTSRSTRLFIDADHVGTVL
jgi:hypothetical protein